MNDFGHPRICKKCRREGVTSKVIFESGFTEGRLGRTFYDRKDCRHEHDPNTTTLLFQCEKGHKTVLRYGPRPCPNSGCAWPEKDGE